MKKKTTLLQGKILLLFNLLIYSTAFSQNENIGFESGNTSNWVCGSGTFGDVNKTNCDPIELPFLVNFNSICENQGGMNATNEPVKGTDNRHTIMSEGSDPNSFNAVSCVAPANLFPANQNTYSFRLGNSLGYTGGQTNALANTVGMQFKLAVNPSNAKLTCLYSVFLSESPSAHLKNEAPRFIMKILNAKDSLIPNSYTEITPENSSLKDGFSKDQSTRWKYSDWTKVDQNLSAYIGQTVTIIFMTGDCFPSIKELLDTTKCKSAAGMHSAYAYLDLYTTSIPTGISTNKNNLSVELFPNPMNSETNIRIAGLLNEGSTQLVIYDCLGKKIKSQAVKNGSQKLYREGLSNGIYFIEIVDKNGVLENRKLFVND